MLFSLMVFCCLVLTRAQYRGISRTTNCNSNRYPFCEERVSVHGSNDPYSGDSFDSQPPYYPPIRNPNDPFRPNPNPIDGFHHRNNQQNTYYGNYDSDGGTSHSVSESRHFSVITIPEEDPVYRSFSSNQFGSDRDRHPSDLNPFRNRQEQPFINNQYDDRNIDSNLHNSNGYGRYPPEINNNNREVFPPRNQSSVIPDTNSLPQEKKVLNQCTKSKTTINGGQTVCTGALLFEDHFNKGQLNTSKWQREQYVAGEPDNEFVTYEKRAQNCFIKNTVLHLKTILRENPAVTEIDLTNGCTGKLCSVSVNEQKKILPPIVAGKIKSIFSFLYGKVEIRAQLPKGNWIYPQVNLDPLGEFSYAAGRLWVAYARGNVDLKRQDTGEQIGNSVLYAGGVLGQAEPARTYAALKVPAQHNWGDDFHVYTLIWTPDGINILVDGEDKGHINPPYTNSNSANPFNEEYVISLGIAAGGFSDFPEGSTSNGNRKPWKRLSVRPVVNFYENRDQWYPTWDGDNSALKVDYVKVWAL